MGPEGSLRHVGTLHNSSVYIVQCKACNIEATGPDIRQKPEKNVPFPPTE